MNNKITEETAIAIRRSAKTKSAALLESLVPEALADFNASASESFKIEISVVGCLDGSTVRLRARGCSTVDMKRRAESDVTAIDNGPALFGPEEGGDQ